VVVLVLLYVRSEIRQYHRVQVEKTFLEELRE